MYKGYLAVVLHAHLPYVRHPEHIYFLEEDWLYEAIEETYIPLIEVFERLLNDGIDFKMTMSLTPPLISMLQDELLQDRFVRHLAKLIELAEKEVHRTKNDPDFNNTAKMYHNKFKRAWKVYIDIYKKDITKAFKKFQDSGNLEIITCAATHGYMPLMELYPEAVYAQVKVAKDHYRKVFGVNPKGIWLPECGYQPGHDEILAKNGINYFYVDTHGILHGTPRPKYGIYAPVYCRSGVAAFGRDIESSKSVWSAEEGYPGDYNYREFYRDVGYDLEFDYIKDYIHPDGIRINTGIKYYKITGRTNHKQPYSFEGAMEKVREHAGNFMFNREKQIEYLYEFMGNKKPIVVSPYDAELFGHWWYEGPLWLECLMRKMYYDQKIVKMATATEYLRENSVNQVVTPSLSSWGNKGYSEVWLEGSNDWIYRHLHKAAERMIKLAKNHYDEKGIKERALNQAARELLLAQSSDWAFIMKTNTVVEYAVKRTKDHISNFSKLYYSIKNDSIDENSLKDLEEKNNIFADIDYRIYRS